MAIGIIGNDEKNQLLNQDISNKYFDKTFHIDLNNLNESHSLIIKNINDNSKVLDIGCSQGLIGEALKKYKNCNITGIELDKEAAKIAIQGQYYDNVFCFDITNKSSKEYKEFFKTQKNFDYIIFSDVLEHLLYPSNVLFDFAKLLKNGGNAIISLPNIAHYDIVDGLLNEKFNYSKMGILDNTHLRFFTKYSFLEYINEANKLQNESFVFELESIDRTIIKPYFYEKYEYLTRIINENDNLIALQNIFVLKKCSNKIKTINLQKAITEKHINLTDKINKALMDLDEKSKKEVKLENENNNLNSYITDLKIEKDRILELYSQTINTKSWKITRPFRFISYTVNNLKELIKDKRNKKLNVLFFVQSWLDLNNLSKKAIGGTTLHILDLINNLEDKINPYIITVINNKYFLIYVKDKKQYIYDLNLNVCVYRFDGYHYDFLKKVIEVIEELEIDLLHMHHFINFPCDLQYLAKKYKTVFTLHDYTCICPNYFLINKEKKYCKNAKSKKCLECSKNLDIDTRNTAVKNLFDNLYNLIVPDESVINEIMKYYEIKDFTIIPNGVKFENYKKFDYNKSKNKNEVKRIALVGIVNDHKGSEIIKKMIQEKTENFSYYLFGDSNDVFFKENYSNYNYCGIYNNEELPKLLNDNKIDLVLMLSVCPESFSYVLSEVMIAKIPVITLDIGAIANRVKKYQIGKVVEYDSNYKIIIKEIEKLLNSSQYDKYLKNLEKSDVPSIKDMCRMILNLYNKNQKTDLRKDYFKKKRYLEKLVLIKKI